MTITGDIGELSLSPFIEDSHPNSTSAIQQEIHTCFKIKPDEDHDLEEKTGEEEIEKAKRGLKPNNEDA